MWWRRGRVVSKEKRGERNEGVIYFEGASRDLALVIRDRLDTKGSLEFVYFA